MKQQNRPDLVSHLGIVGRSTEIANVADEALAVAWTGYPVLITGETGVGKGLLAKAIHQASGRKGSMVVVNVAGLDEHLFSDTLFGHEKAAFSGAERKRDGLIKAAEGGTLFLDEMGDLPTGGQLKLLRLFDDGEYLPLGADEPQQSDARIVMATNQDMQERIRKKAFRLDLYHRVSSHHIDIPPLRRRRNDIPLLLDYFLEEISAQFGKPTPSVSPTSLNLLMAYHYPGNVRELRSLLVNAIAHHHDPGSPLIVDIEGFVTDQPDEESKPGGNTRHKHNVNPSDTVNRLPTLKETEERLIAEALRRAKGIQTAAASMLGITQQALSQRLKRKKERQRGSNAETSSKRLS